MFCRNASIASRSDGPSFSLGTQLLNPQEGVIVNEYDSFLPSSTNVTDITAFLLVVVHHPGMSDGFFVFRELEDGEVLNVAWRQELEQADELVRELGNLWPGKYFHAPAQNPSGSNQDNE